MDEAQGIYSQGPVSFKQTGKIRWHKKDGHPAETPHSCARLGTSDSISRLNTNLAVQLHMIMSKLKWHCSEIVEPVETAVTAGDFGKSV